MIKLILLDAGPLGHLAKRIVKTEHAEWYDHVSVSGYTLVVPEITDFEVRRELIRGALLRSVRRLDRLKQLLLYLPINTHAMLIAAELWAEVRNSGRPTADIQALDADTILAGQAATCQQRGVEVVVSTENVRHLETMTNAIFWLDIR